MTYAVVAFMRTETRLHPGNRYTTLVDATLADWVELRNGCRSAAVTFQVSVVAWNISDEAVEHWAIGGWGWSRWRSFRTPRRWTLGFSRGQRFICFYRTAQSRISLRAHEPPIPTPGLRYPPLAP